MFQECQILISFSFTFILSLEAISQLPHYPLLRGNPYCDSPVCEQDPHKTPGALSLLWQLDEFAVECADQSALVFSTHDVLSPTIQMATRKHFLW